MDQPPTSGSCENAALLSIRYKRGHLDLLDQRRLPMETSFLEISDSTKGWHAIKDMVVRGAPAIAIAAALSLAVELVNLDPKPTAASEALQYIHDRLDYLVSSRPTAVNLYDTVFKLKEQTNRVAAATSNAEAVFNAYVEAAEKMLVVDVTRNMAIGAYGADLILNEAKGQRTGDRLRVLTHCNTGSLATAAYGTALGVIRALHSRGKLETVYCTETRPFNQGSRLTAYELVYDKIPAVLIADSAAAALQSLGKIDVVVVGADRITANGDTANKIGTYNLALSSFHHGIPFYVAAPLTSIDISLSSGETIVIEERPSTELTHAQGDAGSQVAASGVSVWNPAFDITPAKLITAIITDEGIITKYQGSLNFDIHAFCHEHDALGHAITNSGFCKTNTSGSHLSNGCKSDNDVHGKRKGFYILDVKTVVEYIRNNSKLAERLGGVSTDWIVKEVGDGNLNFVYIVVGPNGSFVLKQSVPYVRCVGESWPMSSDRSYYEALALKQHGSLCPQHVPEVYHFDRGMATIIMRYLEPPHIILRKGLIKGIVYPLLADHMSEYMARTLFHTSLLAISTKTHRSSVAEFCGNVELCRLTEQVIFTEPYMEASNNRWTSPQLDQDVKDLHEDKVMKVEIAGLKAKFCERSQSLIHGDLHTGSIMVTASSTQVIDPEFSFYGPIGFDVGAFLGNLMLAYFSQDGHAEYDNDRQEYKKWMLSTIGETWNAFEHKFLSMWTASWGSPGDAYPAEVYKTTSEKLLAQRKFMKEIFEDSLGFAAAKIIRRIVGIAHVEDFESIQNPDRRSECEQQALKSAKMILKERRTLSSIEQVIELISQKL